MKIQTMKNKQTTNHKQHTPRKIRQPAGQPVMLARVPACVLTLLLAFLCGASAPMRPLLSVGQIQNGKSPAPFYVLNGIDQTGSVPADTRATSGSRAPGLIVSTGTFGGIVLTIEGRVIATERDAVDDPNALQLDANGLVRSEDEQGGVAVRIGGDYNVLDISRPAARSKAATARQWSPQWPPPPSSWPLKLMLWAGRQDHQRGPGV